MASFPEAYCLSLPVLLLMALARAVLPLLQVLFPCLRLLLVAASLLRLLLADLRVHLQLP